MEISESGAILSYISGEQNLADLPSRTLARGTQLSTSDIISALKDDTQNPAATRASRRYRLIDDDLYYVTKDGEFPVIPSEERNTALLNLHLSAGHLSPTALHTLIRQTYRWDHMEDDIKSCDTEFSGLSTRPHSCPASPVRSFYLGWLALILGDIRRILH